MRLSIALIMAAAVYSGTASAQPLVIQGEQLEIVSYAISKSTSARLVDIYSTRPLDNPQNFGKRVYIPAGMPLAIFGKSYNDRSGNTWHLATTYDGILVYIIGNNKYQSKSLAGFYGSEIFDEKTKDRPVKLIAVAQSKKEVQSKLYPSVTLTQSEVYAVDSTDPNENTVSIILDKSKMGADWKGDDIATVSAGDVEVLSRDAFLDSAEWSTPFLRYDVVAEAKNAVMEAFRAKTSGRTVDTNEVETKVSDFLSRRFIENKNCESDITVDLKLSGELGVDISSIISPITAKLSLTGGLSGEIVYKKGEEFEVDRVSRSGLVYEIKTDRTRGDCASQPQAVRIFISGSDNSVGELTAGEIEDAGFVSGRSGFPLYTCRQEFLALRDILSNKYKLPTPIATFVIAHKGEYRPTDNASKCSQTKVSG